MIIAHKHNHLGGLTLKAMDAEIPSRIVPEVCFEDLWRSLGVTGSVECGMKAV
jgi:hypothetical protein